MRTSATIIMAILTICVTPLWASAPRLLVDTRYTPDPVVSRISFNFTGSGRVLHTRLNDRQIRLTFPDTRSGKTVNLTPLVLPHGPAKSVSFDTPDTNTIRAIVTFRQALDYSLRTEGSRIVVDMHPTDTAAVAGSPVDISAMVLEQVEKAKDPTPSLQQTERSSSFVLMPLLIALAIASLGTSGLLFYLNRSASPEPPRVPVPSAKQGAPNRVEAILHEARIILEEKAAPQKSIASTTEGEDGGVATARLFGRGRGEVALVMKMEQQRGEFSWNNARIRPEALKGKPLTAARKLGVGRGEIELARSLQKVREEQNQRGR